VTYLSPDRLVDKTNDAPHYLVNIEVDQASLAKACDLKLQAGMPSVVYVAGEGRTPLQYLMEPLTQALRHAGRER
jgi:HlyD family secretion protein